MHIMYFLGTLLDIRVESVCALGHVRYLSFVYKFGCFRYRFGTFNNQLYIYAVFISLGFRKMTSILLRKMKPSSLKKSGPKNLKPCKVKLICLLRRYSSAILTKKVT